MLTFQFTVTEMWESHQSSHAILVKTANKYNYQNVNILIQCLISDR